MHARSDAAATALAGSALEVTCLAGAERVDVVRDESALPPGCALEIVSDAVSAYLSLKGAVDTKAEISKLEKKIAVLTKSLDALLKQAALPDYEAKVPPQVRAENVEKLAKLRAEIAAAEKGIVDFSALA